MARRHKFLLRLLIIAIIFIILFTIFAVTRFSQYTIYVPFSGRIFNISNDQVKLIQVQNGSTGEYINFTNAGELNDFIVNINGLKYNYWITTGILKSDGWSYRIIIHFQDDYFSYEFDDTWVEVHGVRYITSNTFLSELIAMFDK